MLSPNKCQFSSGYLTYFKEFCSHHYSSVWCQLIDANFPTDTSLLNLKRLFVRKVCCKRDKENTSFGGSSESP